MALASPAALAEDGGGDGAAEAEASEASIRVVQQKPVLKAGRFELQLMGELSVADVMFRHFGTAANARFHVDEAWSVGAGYRHYFSEESSLLSDVTDKFEVFPERSIMRWYAGAEAAWSPLYGKLIFFDAGIVHFDLHLLAGVGVTQTSRSADPRITGVLGVGGRLLVSRAFAIAMELRDHLFVEAYNDGSEIVNNMVLSFGFSIFFPFDHDYRFAK
jgi:outer membrane beta-barrel protein